MNKIVALLMLFFVSTTCLVAQTNDIVAKRSELSANQFCKKFTQNAHRQYFMIDMRSFASKVEQQQFHDLLFKDEFLAVVSTVNEDGLLVVAFPIRVSEKDANTHLYKKQAEAIELAKSLNGKALETINQSIDKNQKR
jgi:hypothetical protein